MHVDRSGLDLSVESPDALEQTIARQHAVAILDEEAQELEFALGQPDRRPDTRTDTASKSIASRCP